MALKDQNSASYISMMPFVTFSAVGGTSVGTFSTVTNNGDGTYSANFTGVTPGTSTIIHAQVNGNEITTELPQLNVVAGFYSLSNSLVSVSANSVASGSSVNVTLTVKDFSNSQQQRGGLTILFSQSSGTSTGTFSAVTDNLDGTYSATFTGITAGSATNIKAQINGNIITSVAPTVEVNPGMPSSIAVSSGDMQSAIVGTAATFPLIAIVKDSYNNVVNGATVDWNVTVGSGSIASCSPTTNSSGLAQCTFTLGTTAGANTITATINGTAHVISFSATGTFAAAASIAVSSGNTQSAIVGTALSSPMIAIVKDTYNNVVPSATVNWAITSGGGSLSSASNSTNANGLSSSTLTVGTSAGANTVSATVNGTAITVSFSSSGTAGAAASIAVSSGDTQSATVGSVLALPLIAIVKDTNNNVINGSVVDWAVTAGGGAVSSCSTSTDASGLAQCTLTTGTTAGTNTITASVAGIATPATFTATGTVGAVSSIAVSSGNTQSAVAGSAVTNPLIAVVKDSNNNVISGVTVTWAVTAGGGAVSSCSTSTDASGLAQCTPNTGSTAGTNTITASVAGIATPATFTATGIAGSPTSIAVSANNNQSGTAGSTLSSAFIAVIKDSNNNVVSGATVDWAVSSGGGSLSSASNSTGSGGLSSSTLTLGTTAGANTATATIHGTAASVTFTGTGVAGASASIAVDSGDGQGATVGSSLALPLIVVVKDANNNVINGATVDWAVTAGGGAVTSCTPTTNSSGLAQCTLTIGTTPGTNTVTATINGTAITTSFGATGITGAISLAQSTLTISSSTITSSATATLTITLKDTYGNQVANATQASNLAITILSTGTSSGSIGAITAVGGNAGAYQATLTATTSGTVNSIKASISASDFTSTKPTFTVNVGAATKLAFVQQPLVTASGSTISPSVTVRALDTYNNFVSTYATDILISIDTNPSGGTLSGTLTKTPSSGVSTFNDLSINYYGTGYKLSATSGSLTAATSAAFNVSATALTYDIPFTSITTPVYTTLYTSSSWSLMEFIGDLVRLTPTVQTDTAAATGTMDAGSASGVVMGTLTDGVNSGLKLGNSGSCNGGTSDCAKQSAAEIYELNSSWTPQWASLVGYWKLNGTEGGIANAATISASVGTDASAKNANASGMSYVSSQLKQGVSFDSIDDSLQIADAAYQKPSVITVSAWVKFNSLTATTTCGGAPSTYQIIIFKRNTRLGNYSAYSISKNNANKFIFDTDSSAGSMDLATSTTTVTTGQWYHVVGTFSQPNLKIYVNGKLEATLTHNYPIDYGTRPLSFGRSNECGGTGEANWDNLFNGSLDDVAIWSTALSDSEVQTLYDRQKSVYSGTFTSRIMNAKSSSSWTTLSWMPTLPFMKELPDSTCTPTPCAHNAPEGSSNYTSLVGSTGSTSDATISSSGLVGLWHLNETAATAGVKNDFKDDSGRGNTGEATGTISFGVTGKIDKAVTIGTNGGINTGTGNYLDKFSISGWINFSSSPSAASIYIVAGRFENNPWRHNYYLNIKSNKLVLGFYSTTWVEIFGTNTTWQPGFWYHVTGTFDGTTGKLYINGASDPISSGFLSGTPSNAGSCTLSIGRNVAESSDSFAGSIDEVAIWNRGLHANEVKQLYQRGASRIKYQVRSCDDNACSGESWQGPDGTSGTYFSELNNNTTPLTGAGDVKATLPSMLFSNFTSPPSANQYFQYRTILESDSGTAALWPELKSTTVDPIHYDASSPSIYGNNGIAFSELNAFSESLGSGGCGSGVGYNLSLDKSTWKYWNGSAWATANGTATQSNIASVIQTNASTFGTQVGRGTVYVKAYLKSSGTSKCELDNIRVGGNK